MSETTASASSVHTKKNDVARAAFGEDQRSVQPDAENHHDENAREKSSFRSIDDVIDEME